jgi:large subunit ribosomal protein L13
VIVINADKIHVTGRKLDQKVYYRHSGYPGGLKEVPLSRMLEDHPTRVIEHAVRGMLPKNRLGRKMIRKLKVYAGSDHPHQAQQPEPLEL